MPDISRITLPSGTTYDIKDATARQAIIGGMIFMGVSTTPITDGGTQVPTIDGSTVTPMNGYVVVYSGAEFVWVQPEGSTAGHWAEFGDTSDLGDLAYKDTASGSFTPSGSVSGSFSGTPVRLVTGNISVPSSATFTGTESVFSGAYTPEGTVTVSLSRKQVPVSPASSGTATYTPAGTVSQPTFSGNSLTSTGTFTPEGTIGSSGGKADYVTISPASSGTVTYTPEGTVSAPTITRSSAGSTTTIKNPTSTTKVASVVIAAPTEAAPANALEYAKVSGETLILYQIGYTTGATITTSNVTVKTGDASYTASAPTFTGTGVRLISDAPVVWTPPKYSFSGTAGDVSVSGTPTGTVSQPTFTGTGVRLLAGTVAEPVAVGVASATFSGTSKNVSVSGNPSGTISLTNTNKTATVSATSGTATYTPAGTVTVSFTGTAGTVTVS